jgi:phytanoyl-CoA hydroxylase
MSSQIDPKPITFQSRFGGLWTDLSNATQLLDGKLALGLITESESGMVKRWIEDGYVVIENAVSADCIDMAAPAISRIYEEGRAFVESYETGSVRLVRVEPRHRGMPHKLVDGYAHSADIRSMIVSDKIVRFLNIIFNEPALAYQGLYFETGSQQDIHQDTAYVRVNRPMEIAGAWIAMEDIQEGSGELEYFVGSHRVPEFLWNGESKWMPYGSSEHPEFLAHLTREAQRMGLKREKFRPKKGDALIWSADLCHGGSPVTRNATRRSFVTHWCPATAEPFYFGSPLHTGRVRVNDNAYWAYSFHGHPADPYGFRSPPEPAGRPQG